MLQDNSVNRPLIIGVTGSIGSGKSTVAKVLAKYYEVISADFVANQILSTDECMKKISERWGSSIIKNGKPDHSAIADIVFNNADELVFLNSLIHPAVLEAFQEIVDHTDQKVVVFEIPLLFEAGLKQCFDFIIMVTAEADIRISRLLKSRTLNKIQITARIQNQMPDSDKTIQSDYVLDNNDYPEALNMQLSILLKQIPKITKRSITAFTSIQRN